MNFIAALTLTEVIEITAAFCLGYRDKIFYLVLILINVLTNPIINLVLMVLYGMHIYSYTIVLILEVLVIITEWKLFEYTLGKCERSYLVLSFTINLSSYLIGLLFFNSIIQLF